MWSNAATGGRGGTGGSGSAVGREAPGRRRVTRARARVGRSPGTPRGARGGTSSARSARRAPRRVQGFFPWRAGPPLRAGSRGGRGRSPRDRGRERARLRDVARATTTPIVSRTRTNAVAAGRVGDGPPRAGRPPREGGRAARRFGTTHRRAAKRRKSARDDSGKPSREGGARPRAPPKRESTSRARLRVDRVDGRARLRSATPVLTRATDRATHPFANLLPRGTSPRARRARAPAGASKIALTNSLVYLHATEVRPADGGCDGCENASIFFCSSRL